MDRGLLVIAREKATEYLEQWRNGARADARAVLDELPILFHDMDLVQDLVYEEFCLRRERGESIDHVEYCNAFPELESSLPELISIHDGLGAADDEGLLDLLPKFPQPGEDFCGHRLVAELGATDHARVFLVRDTMLDDRPIVMKVQPYGKVEANRQSKMAHPNVVPAYSFAHDRETMLTAICMPFVGRTTLHEVLQSIRPAIVANKRPPRNASSILAVLSKSKRDVDPIPEDLAPIRVLRKGTYIDSVIELAAQIADGLHHVHCQGVVHRDLKPENILLAADGRPMIMDFGLSSDESREYPFGAAGTIPYMSPEHLQFDREGKDVVDRRSDIFSFGIVLHEMICGVTPFWSKSSLILTTEVREHLSSQHRAGPGADLRDREPYYPKRMIHVIRKCLDFDPSRRFQTADELALALRDVQSEIRVGRRLLVTASIGLLAVGGIGGGGLCLGVLRRLDESGFELALKNYKKAKYRLTLQGLSSLPKEKRVILLRGMSFLQLKDYARAAPDFRQLSLMRPKNAFLRSVTGYCYHMSDGGFHAAAFYQEAMNRGEKTPELLNNFGKFMLMMNAPVKAVEILDEAIKERPKMWQAYANRAATKAIFMVGAGRSNIEEVKDDIKIALKYAPKERKIHESIKRIESLPKYARERISISFGFLANPADSIDIDKLLQQLL